MKYNKRIRLAAGASRKSTYWPVTDLMWSEFVEKTRIPQRSAETQQDYLRMPKSQQDDLKDVGGFVGGTFAHDRRLAKDVESRDLITLDLDNIPAAGTQDIVRRVAALGCASLIYSTRKHSEYKPRLRVILPLAKSITADEYEPCARKLSELIGIGFCDPTTFEASRLMYWPSVSSDGAYVHEAVDAPFVDPDGILKMYDDWHDVSSWPVAPTEGAIATRRAAKAEDPTTKKGVVGAFCREYDIPAAMEKFLPGMYEPTADPNRYTYTGGSTAGGAIIYGDGLYLYSHHATDPCSGRLVNAFDLVRLHMFGDQDDDAKDGTPVNKLPSYQQMQRFAAQDAGVASRIAEERHQQALEAFGDVAPADAEVLPDTEWHKRLEIDGNGNYKKSTANFYAILECDPELAGKIGVDVFTGRGVVLEPVYWAPEEQYPRQWTDADDAGLSRHLETFYGIYHKDKMTQMLTLISSQHTIDPVRDYLDGLEWDGVPRLDRIFVDYLGADDTVVSRTAARKSFVAAVARTYDPGCKFDNMTIIHGPQGIGKSTLLATMGGEWFSDSLTTFEGKDAAEMLQGVWIIEVGELTAMNKKDTNAVKQFLSKRDDQYRAAYARHPVTHPRRCVFFGTSNEEEFLRDQTGNRRFWPVDVGKVNPALSIWRDLPEQRDQLWAEAVMRYRQGESLHLTKEQEDAMEEARRIHVEDSGLSGMVREFLERKVPERWQKMSMQQRREFYALPDLEKWQPLVERDRVCALEVLSEYPELSRLLPKGKAATKEINQAIEKIPGWERLSYPAFYGGYGNQRGFRKR